MDSNVEDRPCASTSREGEIEPLTIRIGAYQEPSAAASLGQTELWRRVPIASYDQPPYDESGFFTGSATNLAKLQTYLPTGTWVTYTALETWAFSLRPNDPPVSQNSNCNSHQRIALVISLGISIFLAFFTSFIKHFIYDAGRTHVLYPPPDMFNVVHCITDPVTGVQFPCRTPERRYCWPLVGQEGQFVYDESGTRLRVLVFKMGIKVELQRQTLFRRWFQREGDVSDAPRLPTSRQSTPPGVSPASALIIFPESSTPFEIDDVALAASALVPRWTHTVVGTFGSRAYLDFSPSVWGHAFVSLLAFLTLSLLSTHVSGCLYPSIPDYLPSTIQTAMLVILSIVAAVFVRDGAVSLGQTYLRRAPARHSDSDVGAVPEYLRSVTEMLVWVGRQEPAVKRRKKRPNADAKKL